MLSRRLILTSMALRPGRAALRRRGGRLLAGFRARSGSGREGLRWAIDPDTCFRYWNVIGTDCGRCMSVCPYSHPNNAAHNVVRWAIARSGAARRAMLKMDDVFYGRRPKSKEIPKALRM